jgi:hypothetical protein
MEVKAGDVPVFRLPRDFPQLQHADAPAEMSVSDAACFTCDENLFEPFMPEAADRSFSVKYLVYRVNRIVLPSVRAWARASPQAGAGVEIESAQRSPHHAAHDPPNHQPWASGIDGRRTAFR